MIRRVAVVPHPSLLVPELVAGAVAAHDGPAGRFEPSTCGFLAGSEAPFGVAYYVAAWERG